jgi:hypothetical protein
LKQLIVALITEADVMDKTGQSLQHGAARQGAGREKETCCFNASVQQQQRDVLSFSLQLKVCISVECYLVTLRYLLDSPYKRQQPKDGALVREGIGWSIYNRF